MPKSAKSTLGTSGLLVVICMAAGCGSSASNTQSESPGHSTVAMPQPVAFEITS